MGTPPRPGADRQPTEPQHCRTGRGDDGGHHRITAPAAADREHVCASASMGGCADVRVLGRLRRSLSHNGLRCCADITRRCDSASGHLRGVCMPAGRRSCMVLATAAAVALALAGAGEAAAAGSVFAGARAVTASAGVWGTATSIPGTNRFPQAPGSGEVTSVSCARPDECSAGGSYPDSHGYSHALLELASAPSGTAIANHDPLPGHPYLLDMEVIVRRQDQGHRASITCMIRHYVARRAKVIFDHPHNAAMSVMATTCGQSARVGRECTHYGRPGRARYPGSRAELAIGRVRAGARSRTVTGAGVERARRGLDMYGAPGLPTRR